MSAATPAPRATYRLQLRGGIDFREAEALAPYLASLGVSHLYASPCALARSGSSHGYDVVDPTRIDPALGGEEGFAQLAGTLHRHGLALLLDWVPNHVGIGRGENPWWQSVLELGEASPWAEFFDIDWDPPRPELRGKVLLPVLGQPYGAVLEAGELEPFWDPGFGLALRYHEHRFPISPESTAHFLEGWLLHPRGEARAQPGGEALRGAIEALAAQRERRDAAATLRARGALASLVAAEPALRGIVEEAVTSLRGKAGDREAHDALHGLLELQHYRLAFWRVSAEEVNYRRFFDIDDLAALRMERREVFERTHEAVLGWIAAGHVDGLRIDHVDGLADPRGYCARLRERSGPDRYLVVEKILGADEELRDDWPVDGTTGYEFLNLLNGLFVDPRGARPLGRLYRRFTGDTRRFEEVLYASRKRVMSRLLAGEIEGLAGRLDHIAQGDRFTRDYTRSALRDALEEVVASFPVYRCYVDEGGALEQDRRVIAEALAGARGRLVDAADGLFSWLERVLSGDLLAECGGSRGRDVLGFLTRFQQVTAPIMAKGLEDTAFYRQPRLLSLNEVGGDPRRFGVLPDTFHARCRDGARRWPRAMLCTSSHDTKRGEDARARIDVLSELPDAWAAQVRAWAVRNAGARRRVRGALSPSRKDEYLLYQMLVGSWPAEEPDADGLAAFRDRIQEAMRKALREAKERSSWRRPDLDYERATARFVEAILEPGSSFLEAFLPFQAEVAVRGALNSLAATAVKLCAPGVPDLYQGCELWNLSLADPDNRRPVDFEVRRRALRELEEQLGGPEERPPAGALRALLASWRDGRVKLFLTWRLLALRRAQPRLFAEGDHVALPGRGEHAQRLCAFARTCGGDAVLVIAPRLAAGLPRGSPPFPLGGESWGDTAVALPPGSWGGSWRDVLSGRSLRAGSDALALAACFEELPVAVLIPAPEVAA